MTNEQITTLISEVKANIKPTLEDLMFCYSAMDLTTLRSNDTDSYVESFVKKANETHSYYPDLPLPASICVYPNFASLVSNTRCSSELHTTCVAGCFPTSQSFLDIKVKECELAVENGADEIDIVLALNAFLDDNYDKAFNEIKTIRAAIPNAVLKVILETGLLVCPEKIAKASMLAMEAGADFIKTSTGKVEVNATPEAAVVMCQSIKEYYAKTGRKVGFKAAGGISTSEDALLYLGIVRHILGEEWIDKNYFRLGVSRLGDKLLASINELTK